MLQCLPSTAFDLALDTFWPQNTSF